jgi:hypothetical protein
VLAGLGFSNLVQSCLHGKFKDISWMGGEFNNWWCHPTGWGGCCKDVNPNWETSNEFMAKYVSFLQNHPGLKFFFGRMFGLSIFAILLGGSADQN